jgi:hypothetical protein
MATTDQNATIYAGDTVNINVVVTDPATGDPKNLAGATVQWAMFREYKGTVVLTKDTDAGITITDEANGALTIALDASDTENVRPDIYAHEVEVTDSGGNVSTVTTGYITLEASWA